MYFNQISGDKARSKFVSSHAVDEDVGGISADARLDELDGGVEVLANIFRCYILHGYRVIRVFLWIHWRKLLVQCYDMCNVVAL